MRRGLGMQLCNLSPFIRYHSLFDFGVILESGLWRLSIERMRGRG